MVKKTYKVEWQGQTFTRTTDRIYTHVILCKNSPERLARHPETKDDWDFLAWCGRADLAERAAAKYRKSPDLWTNITIVPVPEVQ